MMGNKVSIVMPVYNAREFVRQAIETVLAQSASDIELLIADDASTDDSKAIVESYQDSRIRFEHNEQNMGYLRTCNKLMALATGDFLAFQDADDYTSTDRIAKQLAYLAEHPEVGVVGTNKTNVSEAGELLDRTHYPLDSEGIRGSLIGSTWQLIPNSFVFRRSVYDAVGGYHEFFDRIGAEDYYWTWLLLQHTEVHNLEEPMYYYRYNSSSISGDLTNDYRKLTSSHLVRFLIGQWLEKGSDSLHDLPKEELDAYVKQVRAPFEQDPTYALHYLAKKYFYEGNRSRAIRLSRKIVQKRPFKLAGYRDLLYFLRTSPPQS